MKSVWEIDTNLAVADGDEVQSGADTPRGETEMKLIPENPPLFVLCECKNPEHQAILTTHIEDDWPPFVSLEFHLVTYRNIFKRAWIAIQYVFGYKSKYGEWSDIGIERAEVKRIRDFMNKFLKDTK